MNHPANPWYEFGAFRVDAADRRLFRNGEEVSLSPKVFETLLLLLEKPGQLVGKDELMERLWPGTFVGEDTLAQKISLLRKALNEGNGSNEYISTVPKLGYRFTGEVRRGVPVADRTQVAVQAGEGAASPSSVAAPWKGLRWLSVGLPIMITLCALGIAWLALRHSSSASTANYVIKKLDVSNALMYGVISADGKYLAYVALDKSKKSLWVRPVASTGKGLQVVPETQGSFWGVTFSPDQAYLYYVLAEVPTTQGCAISD